jgi:predicted membrane-bound spermidine synthase
MVNVIVFDIFFLDEYGALAGATLYLLMLLTILVINKEKISKLLIELSSAKVVTQMSFKEKLIKYSIVLAIIVLIFIGDQIIVNFLGYGKG